MVTRFFLMAQFENKGLGVKEQNMDFHSDLGHEHLIIQFSVPGVAKYVIFAH